MGGGWTVGQMKVYVGCSVNCLCAVPGEVPVKAVCSLKRSSGVMMT